MRAYAFDDAVKALGAVGMNVKAQRRGFSLILPGANGMTAQCGIDKDGGISLAVNQGAVGVKKFVRPTTVEMTHFIISAHHMVQTGTKPEWIDALTWANISEGH